MKMRRFEKWFVNSPRHSERVAAEAVRRLRAAGTKPGERLLDVGCGNGAVATRTARTLGLAAVGVDVDAEQVATARTSANGVDGVRFLVADAVHLPFRDGEFDLVYTNKSTHHIRDWPTALDEMARVLAPGGRLVYADFVAPLGQRLPTRRRIDALAAAGGLRRTQHASRPLHYRALFQKPAAE